MKTVSLGGQRQASGGAIIEVDKLNVRYGDFQAVKDLSFHVERGELYALLGTNGAGKTSTLKAIMGLLAPKVAGQDEPNFFARLFGHGAAERRRRDAWLTTRLRDLTPDERALLRQAGQVEHQDAAGILGGDIVVHIGKF